METHWQKTEKTWQVIRQDDNGNLFVMRTDLSEKQARELVREFEARGHKQSYWVKQETS